MDSLRPGNRVPAALTEASALDARGGTHRFGDYWRSSPALLLFLRHFGCIACAEQVSLLLPRITELRGLGVRIVLVGNAQHEYIEPFVVRNGLTDRGLDVVTDPTLGAYVAAGLRRSTWGTWGLRATMNFVGAFGRGFRPAGFVGDVNQQGGAVLVDRDGRVLYAFQSAELGDHTPLGDVVDAALRALAARAQVYV